MIVRLENIRFSFLHVFNMQQPQKGGDGKPAYATHALFATNHVTPGGVKVKDSPNDAYRILTAGGQPVVNTIDAVRIAIEEALRKAGKHDELQAFVARDKVPLHDGVQKQAKYPYYAGMWYVSARNQTRPLILDSNKAPLVEKDARPYSGCYGTATIDTFYYKNNGGGVSATLMGVQFLRDGDAFSGGRPSSLDDFDDVANTGAVQGAPASSPWGGARPSAGADLA